MGVGIFLTEKTIVCRLLKLIGWGFCFIPLMGCQITNPVEETLPVFLPQQLAQFERVGVTGALTTFENQQALSVVLSPERQALFLSGKGANQPSFVRLPVDFEDGEIDVDLAGTLNGRGLPDARGFAGIAFHIDPEASRFEAVYLRFGNGRLNHPVPVAPRDARAVQYIAHPHLHFDVSRRRYPGLLESGAAIGLGQWHHLKLLVRGNALEVSVDGEIVLRTDMLQYGGTRGDVGLYVGDGTEAFFRAVQIRK